MKLINWILLVIALPTMFYGWWLNRGPLTGLGNVLSLVGLIGTFVAITPIAYKIGKWILGPDPRKNE